MKGVQYRRRPFGSCDARKESPPANPEQGAEPGHFRSCAVAAAEKTVGMEELQDDHHAHVSKQLLDDAVFVCVWRGSCSGGKGDVTCRFTGPAGWSYLASQHITCGMIGIPPDTVNRDLIEVCRLPSRAADRQQTKGKSKVSGFDTLALHGWASTGRAGEPDYTPRQNVKPGVSLARSGDLYLHLSSGDSTTAAMSANCSDCTPG
ncbi:hypothetical protein C0Q70_20414 [Pomacea canaliculata]|uniref:Uncharacterized protein n=1 Tax=Pomacea canaliculata TaxID=400727 RepID=A0A2T7NFH8_POMCA|nr:hypothetical protein C0Q70_20414 [Pomacea canaliculata]